MYLCTNSSKPTIAVPVPGSPSSVVSARSQRKEAQATGQVGNVL